MKKFIVAIISILLCYAVSATSQTYDGVGLAYPKREVRAVWLTTIGGLDWPHSYAQSESSIKKQKQELCGILDKLQHANINTVLLQTRVRATSIFETTSLSGNEPWDGCLSGFPGKSPGYDALQFAIEECHRRGMECHAWVVTIPVGKWNATGCKMLRERHPKMVMRIGEEGYMNPAEPSVAAYLASYCADIARRYDVDGISLDYIRYPEAMKRLPQADEGRSNITRIVKAIHDAVRREKPWIKLSCSPIGKHDDTRRFWSHGWNARSRVLQDAKQWMKDGLMDQEYPMMYFRGKNFYPFAVDWQEGCHGKTMVPGLGLYFLDPREGNWSFEDITRELYVLRQMGMGFCMFRSKFFTDNTKGIYDFVSNTFNRYPSLSPAMVWMSDKKPLAPGKIEKRNIGRNTVVEWLDGVDRSNGNYLLYNVYASDRYPVDTGKAENLIAIRVYGNSLTINDRANKYYAVTSLDRFGNESDARQMSMKILPKDVKPGWFYITHPLGK